MVTPKGAEVQCNYFGMRENGYLKLLTTTFEILNVKLSVCENLVSLS